MKSAIILALASVAITAPAPVELVARAPPNIPSASQAQSQLSGLTVAPQGPQTGYSRDLFPHWITQSGTCNTRETVLKRDGTNVVTNDACASVSGRWFSPYDGATWTAASDVDIDHVVPLSNAWKVCFRNHFPNFLRILTILSVWSFFLDHSSPPTIRQRLDQPPTHRCHRQRQPSQGRQGPRRLEAPGHKLLLHVLPHVDQGQERIRLDNY